MSEAKNLESVNEEKIVADVRNAILTNRDQIGAARKVLSSYGIKETNYSVYITEASHGIEM